MADQQPEPKDLFPATTSSEGPEPTWSRKAKHFVEHPNFIRFLRFGALDQNILLLGLLTGVGIDSFIHRKFGVAGYGPIIGAGVSNWIADSIATLPEGPHATLGITTGTLVPLLPFGVLMLMKRSFHLNRPPAVLVGTIVASIFGIFAHEYKYHKPEPDF